MKPGGIKQEYGLKTIPFYKGIFKRKKRKEILTDIGMAYFSLAKSKPKMV
jgi:hypothetical protein